MATWPGLQYYQIGAGIRTQYGIVHPPGEGHVYFVKSTQINDNYELERRRLPKLNDALNQCKDGRGDRVYVLEGHTEDVAVATFLSNLKEGVSIIGCGDVNRDTAPTFSYTATGALWNITKKNVTISGIVLKPGINNVSNMLSFSVGGCSVLGCRFVVGTASSVKFVNMLNVDGGANNLRIAGNLWQATGSATCASAIRTGGVADGVHITDNIFAIETAAAGDGAIEIAHADTGLFILRNYFDNYLATGQKAIDFTDVAASGMVAHNVIHVRADGAAASNRGIVIAGTTNLQVGFVENYVTDEKGKSGILNPAAAT